MATPPLSADMVASCLARFEAIEASVHAWAWLDPERARQLAAEADARPPTGALHGVPVGLKDIIDTEGIPTEYGCAHFEGRVPGRSADLVLALEEAGAVILGKTVTTEMAYFHPGPTRNPWNHERTSGGSSMGSAAAVGAGMVPIAVGTQTNGSVIRPAAFCGVVGYKPTVETVSREGVGEFSATFDTVGGFATSVAAVAVLVAVMARRPLEEFAASSSEPPRFAVVEWGLSDCEESMSRCFADSVAAIEAAGGSVERVSLPEGLGDVSELHNRIQLFEANAVFGDLVRGDPGGFSERLRESIAIGAAVSEAVYRADLRERQVLVSEHDRWILAFDAVLTPPALGEAPSAETTGDPRFCTRWSLLGAPAITLPAGVGPAGLPLGLQLGGRRHHDRHLIGAAGWVERCLSLRSS